MKRRITLLLTALLTLSLAAPVFAEEAPSADSIPPIQTEDTAVYPPEEDADSFDPVEEYDPSALPESELPPSDEPSPELPPSDEPSPELPLDSADEEPVEPDAALPPISEDKVSNETISPPAPPAPSKKKIELTSFEAQLEAPSIAFAINDVASAEEQFSGAQLPITAYDADGNAYTLDPTGWDWSNVDFSQPGLYLATASPDLGDDYMMSEALCPPELYCWVSVQEPGRPELNTCTNSRDRIQIPWILSNDQKMQLDQFAVRISKDGEPWQALPAQSVQLTASNLSINTNALENDSLYEVQVEYPGGQTGILSFFFNGSAFKLDYVWGSRDGSSEGIELPDVVQPAPTPTPESENSATASGRKPGSKKPSAGEAEPVTPPEIEPAQSAPILIPQTGSLSDSVSEAPQSVSTSSMPSDSAPIQLETGTADSTSLSGLRIKKLAELVEPLVITKGNASVLLPPALLQTLQPSDADILSVSVTMPDAYTVSVAATVNETEISALPGAQITVSCSLQEDSICRIENASGILVAEVAHDNRSVTFPISAAGTYSIREILPSGASIERIEEQISANDVKAIEPQSSIPLPSAAVFCGILLVSGAAVSSRRKKK